MRLFALLIGGAYSLVLCGSLDHHQGIERLFDSAREDLRRGELVSNIDNACERGLKLAERSDDRVLAAKFRLLRCEVWLQKDRRYEDILAELRSIQPGQVPVALQARMKMLEGEALFGEGRKEQVQPALESAYQLAIQSGDPETIADIEIASGRFSTGNDAERLLGSALKRAEMAGLSYQEAGALVNLGMNRMDGHRYDEAIGYFERAAKAATPRLATLYRVALSNLASCYNNLGESERAIEILQGSIAQHERSGAKRYLQSALGEAGRTFQQIGDNRRASLYLERALRLSKEIEAGGDAAIWAGNLSNTFSDLKDWDKAEHFNDEAIEIKKSAEIKSLEYNAMNAAAIAAGRGNARESERLYREALAHSNNPSIVWEAHGQLGRLAADQGRMQDALKEFEISVKVVEQKRATLLETQYKLSFLSQLIRLYQWYVDALIANGEFDRALAVADSSRAQTLVERFDTSPERRLSPRAFTNIAATSGATILTYWLGPKTSHAWIVTPEGIRHVEIAPEEEIKTLVQEYRKAIELQQSDPIREQVPSGKRLFEVLIEPVRRWIPNDPHLIIVPDGILNSLNFETLPVSSEPGRYWIEDVTIAIAPSISILEQSHQKAKAGAGLLAIGDPENVDSSFPPLPKAGVEIARVVGHYDPSLSVVKTRKSATPQAYLDSNPGSFDAIHFTAHAVASRLAPLDSAIVLSGGKLYARDILSVPLHASLVTLSACRGMGSRLYNGEGLVGFAWAFLHAGAKNVIAGLWDANDQSTAELMGVLYQKIASGDRPAEALRQAKLSLIHSETNFRKPYYWGAFQIYTVDSQQIGFVL